MSKNAECTSSFCKPVGCITARCKQFLLHVAAISSFEVSTELKKKLWNDGVGEWHW